MTANESVGIILMNTGTTDAPKPAETRVYLREFLSDPRVLDVNPVLRWLLLNLIILPFRPKKSAEAYASIWTDEGSPLLVYTEEQVAKLKERLPHAEIEIGMRYGNPSIPSAFKKLVDKQVSRIIAVPLFPQYASAANGSCMELIYGLAGNEYNCPSISMLPPFYDDPRFIQSWSDIVKGDLKAFEPDHVLLSYHGVPERHCRKSDVAGDHCLKKENCCEQIVHANKHCYRAHCIQTSKALIEALELDPEHTTTTFQSRLGSDPWIQPFTDETIEKLAKDGVKRLAVLTPAFVTDCLETIEEIGEEAKEIFEEHGGEHFHRAPCLNAHDAWMDALAEMLKEI